MVNRKSIWQDLTVLATDVREGKDLSDTSDELENIIEHMAEVYAEEKHERETREKDKGDPLSDKSNRPPEG